MDLLHLVDRLEELVGSAQKMPIGSRAILDRRRVLDIIDQMRVAIPQEVREAQEIVERRDELYREAEEEARLIIARAEERAARMVEEHELTVAARERAEEIAKQTEIRLGERIQEANADIDQRISESRRIAEQQMQAADEYAAELLGRLERQLQAFVRSVQSGMSQLQSSGSAQGASEAPDEEEPPEANMRPIPFPRNDEGGGATFQNLLQRRREPEQAAVPPPAEAGVIDDFAMPQLDDEPTGAASREAPDGRPDRDDG